MLRIFDSMGDTPAQIINQVGETLAQNRLATLLVGDQTGHVGLSRALAYRWFTDPAERRLFPDQDHPRTTAIIEALLDSSAEFADIWRQHPVIGPYCAPKRIEHPRVGSLELHGQSLIDPDQSHILTVFTTQPGSESHEKLQFLSVLGEQLV